MLTILFSMMYAGGVEASFRGLRKSGYGITESFFAAVFWPCQIGEYLVKNCIEPKILDD